MVCAVLNYSSSSTWHFPYMLLGCHGQYLYLQGRITCKDDLMDNIAEDGAYRRSLTRAIYRSNLDTCPSAAFHHSLRASSLKIHLYRYLNGGTPPYISSETVLSLVLQRANILLHNVWITRTLSHSLEQGEATKLLMHLQQSLTSTTSKNGKAAAPFDTDLRKCRGSEPSMPNHVPS